MTLSGNGKEEIRSFQLVGTSLCCSNSLQGHTASTAVVQHTKCSCDSLCTLVADVNCKDLKHGKACSIVARLKECTDGLQRSA